MTNKKWRENIFLAMAVVAISFYYIHNRQTEQAASEQTARDAQELKKEKGVAVLPPGVQEAWDAYVDHQISSMLQRNGTTIQLNDPESKMMSTVTIISVTSPYEIACDVTGTNIRFPQLVTKYDNEIDTKTLIIYSLGFDKISLRDDSSPNVAQKQLDSKKLVYINPDPSGEQPPPLGVNEDSIAAKELRAHLCQRITEKVQIIFTLQPPPEGGVK